jgi:myo-inositol-1(or 4)-monophosphatase
VSGLPVGASGCTAVEVARACAAEASELMRAGFGRTSVSATKGRGDVLTEVDLAIERAVSARIRQEFPAHAILSEETAASTRSAGWMWVIDPIDGTKNFSRSIPHFAFNAALCLDDEPLLALCQQPLLGEEFLAVAGGGASLNGHPMHVSDVQSVREAVVAIDMGYDDQRGTRQLETALRLWPGMQSLRIAGSAALGFAFVAAGRWDIFVHSKLFPWDVAAGLLLVGEAGGVVTDREGKPATIFSEGAVAASPAVHADFMRLAGKLPWRA